MWRIIPCAGPKYATADFQKTDYWRLRGKLDVPKETLDQYYPHCSPDSDLSLLVGWGRMEPLGKQATGAWSPTMTRAKRRRLEREAADVPLLAGLDQLLPWIHQWHPEIDPEFGETAGRSFQTMLEHDAHELGLTLEDPQLAAAPDSDRAKASEDLTMEKLISELLDLPERVRKGDFVLNLAKGVTEPEQTLDQYVVTPQLAACFDDALSFIRSAVDAANSKACYLHGSFGAGKSHFMAVLHLLLQIHNPAVRSKEHLDKVMRQARVGREQEVSARSVSHDWRTEHGIGHPGWLRRSRDGASPGSPRCRESTWPRRSSRMPSSTASGSATRSSLKT